MKFLFAAAALAAQANAHLVNPMELIYPPNINSDRFNGLLTDDSPSTDDDSTFTMSVVGPTEIVDGGLATVTVTKKTGTAGAEWVGAYTAPANVSGQVPLKFVELQTVPGWNTTGSVQVQFELVNMRGVDNTQRQIEFVLLKGGLKYPTAVISAPQLVSFINPDTPLRPRIVPTGNPDSVNLLWSTSNAVVPVVVWDTVSHASLPAGASPMNVYKHAAKATVQSISQSDLCGTPATGWGWHDVGAFATAEISGLTGLEGSYVYYRYGDGAAANGTSPAWSAQEHALWIPPVKGQKTLPNGRPVEIIAFADLGRGSSGQGVTWDTYGRPAFNTSKALLHQEIQLRKGADVIWHIGDISYARGYLATWNFFGHMMAPVVSSRVYYTGVGNHESDWPNTASYWNSYDSGGECGVMTTSLYPLPSPATTNTPWYSSDVGMVHMITMSTEHDFTIGSQQYAWLEADLKAVDRSVTPWVILGGHRPMYVDSSFDGPEPTADQPVAQLLRANVEPLMQQYKVNLGIWGHNHQVSRYAASFNGNVVQHAVENQEVTLQTGGGGDGSQPITRTINTAVQHLPQAPVHVLAGTGGADFSTDALPSLPSYAEQLWFRWGYGRITPVNETALLWEWVDNLSGGQEVTFKADQGAGDALYPVLDRLLIVQDAATTTFKL